jgi:hypothetical protein
MNANRWLLYGACALGLYAVGQVWLVQLSSYRLWPLVGKKEFHAYHAAWWRSIWGVILAPSAVLTLSTALMLWRPAPGVPGWATWAGCALQAALVLGTALWWGPLMSRLESPSGGLDLERYKLMIATHWVRVAIVSAYGLLILWMLAESRPEP